MEHDFLPLTGNKPRISACVTGDDRKTLREHGLIPG
jgi:hypothetical protein